MHARLRNIPICLPLLAACVSAFIMFGLAVLPYPGVQTDEALFAELLFQDYGGWFEIVVFQKKIPLMVMSYVGATKAALYQPIFKLFEPTVWSLRVPVLLLAAVTIPLFYLFLRRLTGNRAAIFGAALLAFDSCYLLTAVLDWGPVVVQHVCLITAWYSLTRAYQENQHRWLAAGFFALGLGMWDKALFIWLLTGSAAGLIVANPLTIKRFIRPKGIVVAIFFFCLGALPLLIYNIRRPLETFRGNTSFSTSNLPAKLNLIPVTLGGEVFFGHFVEEDTSVPGIPARTRLEAFAVETARLTGERRTNLHWAAFIVALLLTPVLLFTDRRRLVLFVIVFIAVAWSQMILTDGAGGGAHHTILLWPAPHILIAVAADWGVRKGPRSTTLLATLGILLCAFGAAVNFHYWSQWINNGSPGPWTEAIFPLSRELPKFRPQHVFLADWGMWDNLLLLSKGALPLGGGTDALANDPPTQADTELLERMLELPDTLFVTNLEYRQIMPQMRDRLLKRAAALGYRPQLVQTIHDYNGRPCYEILRFISTRARAK